MLTSTMALLAFLIAASAGVAVGVLLAYNERSALWTWHISLTVLFLCTVASLWLNNKR